MTKSLTSASSLSAAGASARARSASDGNIGASLSSTPSLGGSKSLSSSGNTEDDGGPVSRIRMLDLLEGQIVTQRDHFEESLANQLKQDIYLPMCVKIVSYLRRLGKKSESQTRTLFLKQRGLFLLNHQQNCEKNVDSCWIGMGMGWLVGRGSSSGGSSLRGDGSSGSGTLRGRDRSGSNASQSGTSGQNQGQQKSMGSDNFGFGSATLEELNRKISSERASAEHFRQWSDLLTHLKAACDLMRTHVRSMIMSMTKSRLVCRRARRIHFAVEIVE